MIDAGSLKDKLYNAVYGSKESDEAQNKFANALVEYLQDNLRVRGSYTGVLSNGSPDPKNGAYQWKITTFILNGGTLKASAQNGFEGWKQGIQTAINGIIIVGADTKGSVNTTEPSKINMINFNIDFSSKPNKMEDAYQLIAQGIVNGLKSSLMNPLSVPATSILGGVGVVAFMGVE